MTKGKKKIYIYTFNRQVVLDLQNCKTNHLKRMSKTSIISFPMDGRAWKKKTYKFQFDNTVPCSRVISNSQENSQKPYVTSLARRLVS
jgi:hypothetical protein